MKRLITTCFYIILTSAVIAAIFFLPPVLFHYEDQKMFAKVEHTEIESVEFTYSYSLFDTLNLLSNGYYSVEYPVSGGTRSADEIFKISEDAFKQMNQYGQKKNISFLSPDDKIIDYTAALQLAISSNYETGFSSSASQNADSGTIFDNDAAVSGHSKTDDPDSSDITSAAIWRCHLYSEYGYAAEFCIDDKSGKIVCFYLWNNPKNTSAGSSDTLIKIFRKFIKKYYGLGVKITLQEKESVNDSRLPAEVYSDTNPYNAKTIEACSFTYTVRLTDEFGNHAQMALCIAPDYVSLNQ